MASDASCQNGTPERARTSDLRIQVCDGYPPPWTIPSPYLLRDAGGDRLVSAPFLRSQRLLRTWLRIALPDRAKHIGIRVSLNLIAFTHKVSLVRPTFRRNPLLCPTELPGYEQIRAIYRLHSAFPAESIRRALFLDILSGFIVCRAGAARASVDDLIRACQCLAPAWGSAFSVAKGWGFVLKHWRFRD
jgi:hypothetical protein